MSLNRTFAARNPTRSTPITDPTSGSCSHTASIICRATGYRGFWTGIRRQRLFVQLTALLGYPADRSARHTARRVTGPLTSKNKLWRRIPVQNPLYPATLTTASRGARGARSDRWQAEPHRRRAAPRSGSGTAALPEMTTCAGGHARMGCARLTSKPPRCRRSQPNRRHRQLSLHRHLQRSTRDTTRSRRGGRDRVVSGRAAPWSALARQRSPALAPRRASGSAGPVGSRSASVAGGPPAAGPCPSEPISEIMLSRCRPRHRASVSA